MLKMGTYGKTKGHKSNIFVERYNKHTRKCFHSIRTAHGRDQLLEDIFNAKSLLNDLIGQLFW